MIENRNNQDLNQEESRRPLTDQRTESTDERNESIGTEQRTGLGQQGNQQRTTETNEQGSNLGEPSERASEDRTETRDL